MEINQEKFILQEPKKEKKQKKAKKSNNNTGVIVVILMFFVFAGGIYYILTLPPEEIVEVAKNEPKQEEPMEENSSFIPPPPEKPVVEVAKTQEPVKIFDDKAIEEKLKEPEIIEEKEPVKEVVEEPKQETKSSVLVTADKSKDDIQKQQLGKPISNEEKTMKTNFETLSKLVEIKTNFFNFQDKNYYEGDTVLGHKIIEVTKHSIKLKNKNNEVKEIQK